MKKFLVAALLAGGIATPAIAQDEAAPNTGLRVEGIVGYDTADLDDGGEGDGVVYGGVVGYDFQVGKFAAGVEAEYSDSDIDSCVSDIVVIGDQTCAESKRDLYIGGRLGVASLSSTSLLYVKAGYTNLKVGVDYDAPGGDADDFSINDELDGVRVGAGVQVGLSRQFYVKGEYRYSNYEQDFDKHQFVGGVGVRF